MKKCFNYISYSFFAAFFVGLAVYATPTITQGPVSSGFGSRLSSITSFKTESKVYLGASASNLGANNQLGIFEFDPSGNNGRGDLSQAAFVAPSNAKFTSVTSFEINGKIYLVCNSSCSDVRVFEFNPRGNGGKGILTQCAVAPNLGIDLSIATSFEAEGKGYIAAGSSHKQVRVFKFDPSENNGSKELIAGPVASNLSVAVTSLANFKIHGKRYLVAGGSSYTSNPDGGLQIFQFDTNSNNGKGMLLAGPVTLKLGFSVNSVTSFELAGKKYLAAGGYSGCYNGGLQVFEFNPNNNGGKGTLLAGPAILKIDGEIRSVTNFEIGSKKYLVAVGNNKLRVFEFDPNGNEGNGALIEGPMGPDLKASLSSVISFEVGGKWYLATGGLAGAFPSFGKLHVLELNP